MSVMSAVGCSGNADTKMTANSGEHMSVKSDLIL